MIESALTIVTDPAVLIAALVSVSVFATAVTLALPFFERGDLTERMRSVALERDQIRARERARLNADGNKRGALRQESKGSIKDFVEWLNLRKALVDHHTVDKLKMAGYRSPQALNVFLFARFVLPFVFLTAAIVYVTLLGGLAEQTFLIKAVVCIIVAYGGFYAPNLYVTNKSNKRTGLIRQSWPDALDLTLICVESGVSIEAALRRVADDIASQSPPLAEELMLTTAELSYLPERRQAYENLGKRTGLEGVKSVTQALIQAERYGTPIAQALRVLAQESRDQRLNEAEKKAAALPPKLTVPMILFFLPVLFGVILGPAILGVMDSF